MHHEALEEEPATGVDVDPIVRVTSRALSAAVVVEVAGEVDLASAADVADVVRAAFESRPGRVVIDLTEVRFLASAGLSVLVHAERTARESNQLLHVVVGEHVSVARSLTTSGLADHFTSFHRLDDALRPR